MLPRWEFERHEESASSQVLHAGVLRNRKVDKLFLKLEDIDQNYEFYEKLSYKFYFENKMTKNKFYNVINKAPNKDLSKKYKYKNWTTKEKNEFRDIIEKIFPHYDNIKTNL